MCLLYHTPIVFNHPWSTDTLQSIGTKQKFAYFQKKDDKSQANFSFIPNKKTLFFMVRNIKCGYSCSKLERAEHFENFGGIFCFFNKTASSTHSPCSLRPSKWLGSKSVTSCLCVV